MSSREALDAVVVGAGPNGLAAAITLARAGRSVLVLEANDVIGGGTRSEELTLPGFLHDTCSAIHPMAALSPFFRSVPLAEHGVEFVHSPKALAHPFEDGRVVTLDRSLEATTAAFSNRSDARRYNELFAPLLAHGDELFAAVLKPVRMPRHPLLMARFGLNALRSCESLVRRFQSEEVRALIGGCAAHSIVPLEFAGTAAFGLTLALSGHMVGWPSIRGGSQRLAIALAAELARFGGRIQTGTRISDFSEIPPARVVLFDLPPEVVASIAAKQLPPRTLRRWRTYQRGPAVFKLDWALSGPIPWRGKECLDAATVHLGGPYEALAKSENAMWYGRANERPFMIVVQQSLFDSSRAPAGKHTAWAYCHVPNGSATDHTAVLEAHIERFAPGFRDLILARKAMYPADIAQHNGAMVGGDIAGGANTLRQVLARPTLQWDPYATPNPAIFLCSSATPPAAGVHGMCGYWAAKSALKRFR